MKDVTAIRNPHCGVLLEFLQADGASLLLLVFFTNVLVHYLGHVLLDNLLIQCLGHFADGIVVYCIRRIRRFNVQEDHHEDRA